MHTSSKLDGFLPGVEPVKDERPSIIELLASGRKWLLVVSLRNKTNGRNDLLSVIIIDYKKVKLNGTVSRYF